MYSASEDNIKPWSHRLTILAHVLSVTASAVLAIGAVLKLAESDKFGEMDYRSFQSNSIRRE